MLMRHPPEALVLSTPGGRYKPHLALTAAPRMQAVVREAALSPTSTS
jgi:hypothetical protein